MMGRRGMESKTRVYTRHRDRRGMKVRSNGVSMVVSNQSVMNKFKHGLDVLSVHKAFLEHFIIFFFKFMGNSPLEF